MALIADGKSQPEARSRHGLKRAVEAEQALLDDVVLHGEGEGEQQAAERFVFVEEDGDGALATPAKNASAVAAEPASVPSRRKPKTFKTGQNRKDKDLQVVDPYGDKFDAADGVVKINLARLILRPVMAKEVATKVHFVKKKLIDDSCWRCLLPRHHKEMSSHPEFVSVGPNTGNLMAHCQQHHAAVLEGLERIIAETPKAEAKFACDEYIANLPPPPSAGPLRRMLGMNTDDVSNDLLCLIWFLDANISFVQFDNELFHQLALSLGGRQFPSSTTMVEKVLPVLYRFAVEHMVDWLKRCRSFFTSFDGWSKFGERFVSQSYHCIDPASFEYRILALDFIHVQTSHWSEVLSGVLQERQECWTAGLDPEPIVAGGIADGASDVQSAGKQAFGDGLEGTDDDMNRCQNHMMKGAYEVLEKAAPEFKAAIDATAALFVSVSNSANVNKMLRAYQDVNEISTAALYVYNDTRWEGRLRLLECALKLRMSLPCLKEYATQQAIGQGCPDFLEDAFFQRLAVYHKHLKVVDNVSRLFQTQRFPTGHLVLLAYNELAKSFQQLPDLAAEPPMETRFRSALHAAIRDGLVAPITTRSNAFAKSAIFHPDICRLLQHGVVSEPVFNLCVAAVRNDIEALSGEKSVTTTMVNLIFDMYLKMCKDRPAAAFMGFDALKESGFYGQTDAMSYWRGIGKDVGNPFASLIPIASMLLALPAGESHNEFVFSTSGRIFTRDRNAMSAMRLEQVTVLVMFIRNCGWSQEDLMKWFQKAKSEVLRNSGRE